MIDLSSVRKETNKLLQEYKHIERTVKEETKNLQESSRKVVVAFQAQQILQEIAANIQAQAHLQIVSVVTRSLKTVFGDKGYDFKINFNKKRGKTEAELVFIRDGHEINPIDAGGIGVMDVASFALRLVAIMMSRPKKRRLLVCDEPFKHLSDEHRPAVREMLMSLAKELGFQILIVTHSRELMCGKVVEIR